MEKEPKLSSSFLEKEYTLFPSFPGEAPEMAVGE
jgi:hypothetical protein